MVIDENGKSLGELSIDKAKYLAFGKNMDIILVSSNPTSTTVKMASFDKIRYENQKRERKKKIKSSQVKEIRLSPNTGDHDIDTQVRKALKFISEGNKIRVMVVMKGRENIYSQKAFDVVNKFAKLVGKEVENPIQKMGNRVIGNLK